MRQVLLIVFVAMLAIALGGSSVMAQTPAQFQYQSSFIYTWMYKNLVMNKFQTQTGEAYNYQGENGKSGMILVQNRFGTDEGTTPLKVGPKDQDQDQDRLRLQTRDQTCDCGGDCECDGSQKGKP